MDTRVVRRRRPPARRHRGRRVGIVVLSCVAVVAAAVAGFGWYTYQRVNRVDLRLSQIASSEPQNYLLVGSDSRKGITRSDANSAVMLGKDAPGGQRSDSISVLRVDPSNDRIDVLSIPRDLWVTLPSGQHQRINVAYAQSTQTLIDTIQSNLHIPVHHFVEVDFKGFQKLIDALGGVPMYFDAPVRDSNSGLRITSTGCAILDGPQGLAFARSRHLQWKDASGWHTDPSADLGRMTRQQLLMRAALKRARGMGLNDIGRLKGLIDAGIDSTKVDSGLDFGELMSLGQRFSDFDPQRLQTHTLTTTPFTTDGGAAVLRLDEAQSKATLDFFGGASAATAVTTTTTPPPKPRDVTVSIYNGGGVEGEGRRVSYVLSGGGFTLGAVESSPKPASHTTVSHGPGGTAMAKLVGAWLGPAPQIIEDKSLASGTVSVTLGSDFRTVAEPATGSDASASPDGAGASGSASGDTTNSAPSPSSSAPSTTTTTPPGWTPGVAPKGAECG